MGLIMIASAAICEAKMRLPPQNVDWVVWLAASRRRQWSAPRGLYAVLMRPPNNPYRFLIGEGLNRTLLQTEGGASMLDFVLIGLALGLFALTVGYAIACDQL
jgi:hypothetical protein